MPAADGRVWLHEEHVVELHGPHDLPSVLRKESEVPQEPVEHDGEEHEAEGAVREAKAKAVPPVQCPPGLPCLFRVLTWRVAGGAETASERSGTQDRSTGRQTDGRTGERTGAGTEEQTGETME